MMREREEEVGIEERRWNKIGARKESWKGIEGGKGMSKEIGE